MSGGSSVIHQAHRLRGEEKFDEAINLLYSALRPLGMNPSLRLATLLAETECSIAPNACSNVSGPAPAVSRMLSITLRFHRAGWTRRVRLSGLYGMVQRARQAIRLFPDCINALALAE